MAKGLYAYCKSEQKHTIKVPLKETVYNILSSKAIL